MDKTAQFYAQPSYLQYGRGLPVYSGSRRQRGGSVLGALQRFIMPFLSGMKRQAVQRVKSGALGLAGDVLTDTLAGRNMAQSLKKRALQRGKQLGKNLAHDAVAQLKPSRKRKAPAKAKASKARRTQNF